MSSIEENKKNYPSSMDQEFIELISKIFGDDLVVGFINGRPALYFAKPDMDVDVFVVLQDRVLKDMNDFKAKWKQFVVGYRDIHTEYGFKPDNEFPGDFATVSQMQDVVDGRGFSEKDGQIYMEPMSGIEDESDENDYRIFRSMLIIGRPIVGDDASFYQMKEMALKTLIKYFFIIKKEELSVEMILQELVIGEEKENYGFDMRYEPALSEYVSPLIKKALLDLNNMKYIDSTSDGKYQSTNKLLSWGKNILTRNWTAEHLMQFQDSYYVKERSKIFADVVSESHWDKLKR